MITSIVVAKLLSTIALVMGLSWVAERIDTRFAGILSGMPLGALLVLFFIGNDLGAEFAATSALYGIPSLAGTLVFSGIYYLLSRTDHPLTPVTATLGAFACQLVAAFGLSHVTFNLAGGVIFISIVIAISSKIFKHIPEERVVRRVRLTAWHMLFRAGLAAVTVLSITSLSEALGPLWSGLLIGFPITFLPFLLVIHVTYSRQHAHTVIRNFPAGLGGVICYLMTVNLYAVDLGVNVSIVLGVLASLVYLAIISFALRNRTSAS